MSAYRCPEAAYGRHSTADPQGRCYWCHARIEPPARRPDRFETSDLSDAYRRAYDPDWGGGRWDR
jgi:hypothetical protein